ncbi:hypothetical protein CH262_03130 [Rhodococcus sp. 05-2255-1e]|nr:hypothetical protein CH262_03130 [Rhodococcus sp. 05-2255-1e]
MSERDRHQHRVARPEHIPGDEGRIDTTDRIHRQLFSDYVPAHRHLRPPPPPERTVGQRSRDYR